jgi:hypothetical protein
MTQLKPCTGLTLRKGIWHIDKIFFGKRLCESTHTSDRSEAEALVTHRWKQAREEQRGAPGDCTFKKAATKYLRDFPEKVTLERDKRALQVLSPYIDHLALKRVHMGRLEPYIRWRLDRGQSPATVNRDIAIVRRILNLASRVWRDGSGRPWLDVAPIIPELRHPYPRLPYPLSVAEQ